jgi:hypothetical protein
VRPCGMLKPMCLHLDSALKSGVQARAGTAFFNGIISSRHALHQTQHPLLALSNRPLTDNTSA